jgi:hypothetical protein
MKEKVYLVEYIVEHVQKALAQDDTRFEDLWDRGDNVGDR